MRAIVATQLSLNCIIIEASGHGVRQAFCLSWPSGIAVGQSILRLAAFLAVPLGCLFVVAVFADEQLLRLRG